MTMPSSGSTELEKSGSKHSEEVSARVVALAGVERKSTGSLSQELTADQVVESLESDAFPGTYRLYRRRFVGLVALVFLNLIAAMSWPWFGPISNSVASDFNITLDEVNWLGNIVAVVYLPTALLIPVIISRYGIRRCCEIGAVALILSAWIRYSGTARSLSPRSSYSLLILGQFFVSIAQPVYQVIGPKYSETWFNLQGRTTATMIVAISNPVGGALGQLISPLIGDSRRSILILGIMSTAVAPLVFLIHKAPPSPPTYAAAQKPMSLLSLIRAMLGLRVEAAAYMTRRERIDFAIIIANFAVLVAASNGFAILSAQILEPVGYSDDESGLMGACLLLAGMVAAIISAPLFDRVFVHHLAITAKFMIPFAAIGWFSLIWAVRPDNGGALFAIMGIIGICSVPMLAVGMELACEITRNAEASSAILWFAGNLFAVVFILVAGALRAGPEASPPLNMRRYLVFMGVIILTACSSIFFLHGAQKRKALDQEKAAEVQAHQELIQRTDL
ncbi:MFS-type transporter [Psilocybe cubensis]|uniref:MFS-type transporter n=2 Tax=Psilocybe cubensis TaxID=181762 RepID=A0ACB8HB84_PSICU|nr:MFS-type transporter [Psilocybe cubensis]KAH9484995.1 MFS-type transporter [Psilocybe cubensis]